MTSDICSPLSAALWNQELILNRLFSQKLKFADVTPMYKEGDSAKVKNYRPVTYSIEDLQKKKKKNK